MGGWLKGVGVTQNLGNQDGTEQNKSVILLN